MKGNISDSGGGFYAYLSGLYNLFLLNLVWILCSLPIITMGAASTALYYVTMKMAKKEEKHIVKSFFYSFRQNFKQGIFLQLIRIVILMMLGGYIFISPGQGRSIEGFIRGVCICSLILETAVFSYAFPLLSKFDNTLGNTLINSAKLAVMYPLTTLRLLLLNLSPLILAVVLTEFFIRTLILWLFIGAALIAYLNSIMLSEIFEKLIPEDKGV